MMGATQSTGNTWTREIDSDGCFVRVPTDVHGRIARDRSSSGAGDAQRYHLYVSHACPWAHRTLVVRALKGLETVISVDVVHPYLTDRGWSFDTSFPGVAATVHLEHIRHHYYASHRPINPTGIVPAGPDVIGQLPVAPEVRAAEASKVKNSPAARQPDRPVA